MSADRCIGAFIACIALLSMTGEKIVNAVPPQSPSSTSPIPLIPRTREEREQRYRASHRITLNVQVTDAVGNPVNELKPGDFTLLDGQKMQTIATFREVDGKSPSASVHVLLVLDAINEGGLEIGRVKREFGKFLSDGTGPLPYPVSLVLVTENGVEETSPSAELAVLTSELARLTRHVPRRDCDEDDALAGALESRMTAVAPGSPNVQTAIRGNCMVAHLRQSVNALLKLLAEQQNVPGRAILIWTGPGWPLPANYGSDPGPERSGGNFLDVLVEISTYLREAQVTLDAVSWAGFARPKDIRNVGLAGALKGQLTPDQAAEENLALPVLARQSGGLAFEKSRNLADSLAACFVDADQFYALSFDSAPSVAPDEFRSLTVQVNRPGTTVRTTSGYYAEP
jgi:VWFA-related protein